MNPRSPMSNNISKPYIEIVKEIVNNRIIASEIREPTLQDFEYDKMLHKIGICPHNIVVADKGWMWDVISCYTCGQGRGIA